jgi:mono/diheme cytochrome c family protein
MLRLQLPTAAVVVAFVVQAASAVPDDRVARGRYLAHQVAMCVQCHSPRLPDGSLDETKLFTGAPVPFADAPFPGMHWATRAPAIAGLPGFTDEDEITLLTTGRRGSGRVPDPPMPPFRFNRDDAAAIVAYLRSLGAPTPGR